MSTIYETIKNPRRILKSRVEKEAIIEDEAKKSFKKSFIRFQKKAKPPPKLSYKKRNKTQLVAPPIEEQRMIRRQYSLHKTDDSTYKASILITKKQKPRGLSKLRLNEATTPKIFFKTKPRPPPKLPFKKRITKNFVAPPLEQQKLTRNKCSLLRAMEFEEPHKNEQNQKLNDHTFWIGPGGKLNPEPVPKSQFQEVEIIQLEKIKFKPRGLSKLRLEAKEKEMKESMELELSRGGDNSVNYIMSTRSPSPMNVIPTSTESYDTLRKDFYEYFVLENCEDCTSTTDEGRLGMKKAIQTKLDQLKENKQDDVHTVNQELLDLCVSVIVKFVEDAFEAQMENLPNPFLLVESIFQNLKKAITAKA